MKENVTVNYFEINGNNYIIVNEVNYNNNHYVYLVNEDDENDMMIKKLNGDMLEPLTSREEFNELLKLLIK